MTARQRKEQIESMKQDVRVVITAETARITWNPDASDVQGENPDPTSDRGDVPALVRDASIDS